MRFLKAILLSFAGLAFAGTARGDVKPHPIFSDNMVLQQGVPVRVWGKADPGEPITALFTFKRPTAEGEASAGFKADKDGNWDVTFDAQAAGTACTLTVKGKNTVTFKNIAGRRSVDLLGTIEHAVGVLAEQYGRADRRAYRRRRRTRTSV